MTGRRKCATIKASCPVVMPMPFIARALCFTALLGISQLASAETVRYINGHWFDGAAFAKREVTVRDGQIADTGAASRTVDLRGGYVIPGLAEAHNHNLQNCYLIPRMAQSYLQRGILYSAQLYATDPKLAECSALFDGNAAPATAFARIGVTSTTGHPIGIARAGAKEAGMNIGFDELTAGMLIADTVDDLHRHWPRFKDAKTDFVKVVLIDGSNSSSNFRRPELDGFNGVTPEVLAALMPLARQAGLRVVAHVDTADDFRLAVEAGVDTIAHLPGYRIAKGKALADYRISSDMAARAAAKGVRVIPTMAASSYHVRAHPNDAAGIARLYADNLRLLRSHRVQLLSGSDRFEGSVLDEIDALAKTGLFRPAELIAMSSIQTAQWMFPRRRVGCLERGCEASFNVYAANPLDDLGRLAAPALVVKEGTVLVGDGQARKAD